MKKAFLVGLLSSVMSLTSALTHAQVSGYYPMPNQGQLVTQDLPGGYFHLTGGVHTLDLKGQRYVESLVVSAEGIDRRASFTVNVNNEIKQTIHVPGRDPNYVVTIRAYVNSIQFVHLSGRAKISSVTATLTPPVPECTTQATNCAPVRTAPSTCAPSSTCTTPVITPVPVVVPVYGTYAQNEPSEVALKAIALIDQLRFFSSDEEIIAHLTPIKAAASSLYATAQVRSGLSQGVRTHLASLMTRIGNATGYIESNYQRTAVYGLALELTALYSRIDLMLR